jgi:hypothetical protein
MRSRYLSEAMRRLRDAAATARHSVLDELGDPVGAENDIRPGQDAGTSARSGRPCVSSSTRMSEVGSDRDRRRATRRKCVATSASRNFNIYAASPSPLGWTTGAVTCTFAEPQPKYRPSFPKPGEQSGSGLRRMFHTMAGVTDHMINSDRARLDQPADVLFSCRTPNQTI